MKKNASALSIAYFTFLLMIIFSGSLEGIMSECVYFLAYFVPFLAVIILTDREVPRASEFSLSRDSKRLFYPMVFPTVLVIIILSLLTSALVSLCGGGGAGVDVGEDLLFALFYHALLPSVLEELLFRYLPMRYVAPYSPKYAVLFSGAFFALAHHSFFSIPYAFFAGVAFMAINLLCESSLPSIILHFVNNAISVLFAIYFTDFVSAALSIFVIFVLASVSVFFIVKNRHRYSERISVIFSGKWERYFPLPMILSIVISLFAAAFEILA